MRLRPQKTCKHSGVSGICENCGEGGHRGTGSARPVDERLNGHYRVDAVRAHLLEMAGDTEAALAHYRAAAQRTTSLPEQRHLATRAARLRMEAPTSADSSPR
jgi:predicted RNA polymerase sigma factor